LPERETCESSYFKRVGERKKEKKKKNKKKKKKTKKKKKKKKKKNPKGNGKTSLMFKLGGHHGHFNKG